MNQVRESATEIEAAASAWVAKADRGALTSEDQRLLEAWAAEDPRRAGAYARALAANLYLDRAVALGPEFLAAPEKGWVPGRRRLFLKLGAAAAAAAVSGVAIWLSRPELLVAGKGDVRRVALAEGSAVTLNTDTRIEPEMGPTLRRVNLVQGEALFDVAKDPARPFVVFVNDVRVQAIGTSFIVRRYEDGTVAVTVREGVVELLWNASTERRRLQAGGSARVLPDHSATAEQLSVDAIERTAAWRQGLIDLDGMTLADAAREFARYSDRRILMAPDVADLKISGIYSTSDPEGFAKAAALSLGLGTTLEVGAIRIHRP